MTQLTILVLFGLFFAAFDSYGETITAKRIASTLRFIPLQKMTVGPDDQYHGSVDPSGTTLAFTRKSDLVSHLMGQSLATGEVMDLLPPTADSQEPSFSPDGILAFTYFKSRAGGDICYKPFRYYKGVNEALTCLKINSGEPSNPFWVSSKELGYLLKEDWSEKSKIIVENIEDHTKKVIVEGQVWSPSMKAGGRYLFFNQFLPSNSKREERALMVRDLQTQKTKQIRFSLPGISGFPAVSDDEKFLFFSHYLNDTNNDNVIDGNDNSVLFRIPVKDALEKDEVFPEQLTSVESNCSFPKPYRDVIYATCAFEGALDIYQLPVTGIIPSQWNEQVLFNAHQTARSYAERILILNTMKYRFPNLTTVQLEERVLSNHIMADDMASSKFYLQRVTHSNSGGLNENFSQFYNLLGFYLDAREIKKIQKTREVTPVLFRSISDIRKRIDQTDGPLRYKKILKGLLSSFLNRPEEALKELNQVPNLTDALPLERYFYFELASWVFPRTRSIPKLEQTYREMMQAPEFSSETQIYYAFQYLKFIQSEASRSVKDPISERISRIEKMDHDLPKEVSSLLQFEISTLKLIQSSDNQEKGRIYGDLDRLMSLNRNLYFLRKASYIRSITNFAEVGEFRYLNFIATNWLRYTQTSDTEFINAREVFAFANLDQAYDSLQKKNPQLASGFFFGSLSLTDDLESHYGFIESLVAQDQRLVVDERYRNLKSHQQIEDNLKFVDALLILVDAKPSVFEVNHLDLAISKLKAMEHDRDSAMRYLLLGYCYLEKLLRTGAGFEFDQSTFENAHQNLMLAYDQGLGNDRIEASALNDLALLHFRVQNFGLSVKFFSKRKSFGFLSQKEKFNFAWFYSRALYFNYQPDKASEEVATVLPEVPKDWTDYRVAFLERLGFYSQASGKFEAAVAAYDRLLKEAPKMNELNLAKVQLSYGYSLFKLKRFEAAANELKHSLDNSAKLQVLPKKGNRWIEFEPRRLQLVAFGLLGQIGLPKERLEALRSRRRILSQSESILDQWLSTRIQNELKIAYLEQSLDPEKAFQSLREALMLSGQLGQSGQYLSQAVFQTLRDFYSYSILHSSVQDHKTFQMAAAILQNCLKAYDSQKNAQGQIDFQRINLLILSTAHDALVLKKRPINDIKETLNTVEALRLRDSKPELWNQVQSLASAFLSGA